MFLISKTIFQSETKSKFNATVLITLIAFLFLFWETFCGLVFTFDSYEYLASAKNFRENGSILRKDGTANTIWGPLFPMIIALTNLNPKTIQFINYAVLLTTISLTYNIAKKLVIKPIFFVAMIANVALHSSLHMNYSFLWSEPIFILLLMAHLSFLIKYLEQKSKYDLLISLIFGFLMCLQRNAGIFLVMGSSIYLFFFHKPKISFFYGLVTSSGWLAWNIRNFLISKTEFHPGVSEMAQGRILEKENVFEYLIDSASWLIPNINVWLSIPIFVVFWLTLTYILFKINKAEKSEATPLLYFNLSTYWVFMQFVEDKRIDEVQRYNSVLIPIFYILLFIVIEKLFEISNLKKSIRYIIISYVIALSAYNAVRSLKNINEWHKNSCFQENKQV
ncbi:MAG: hypothetical protein SNJ77_03260 [Cytophagales bacterium]